MVCDQAEGGADCTLMRGEDPFIARQQRHDRDRFRGVDRKIPPRMMLNLAVADAPELLLLDLAGEQRLERPAVDRARQPEPGRNFPAPLRGFVPALGVIIAYRIIAGDIAGLASEAPRDRKNGV